MADVNAALIEINKGVDKKEDTMLMLSPDTNWERFLTPTPYTISLLGELMLISGHIDFSLEQNAPREGFRYLRHPSSFKACLVQVSNEGWSAFNEAHTNMDQIRLHSANVERHIKSSVKLLLGGTNEEVTDVLPVCLKSVSSIADTCKRLASCSEEKFLRVMGVIEELLEVSTSSKALHESKYRETVCTLDRVKQQEQEIKNSRYEMKERSTKLREDMERAQQELTVALNSISSDWKMLAFSVIEGAINSFKGLCAMFRPKIGLHFVFSNQPTNSLLEREKTGEKSLNEERAYKEIFCLRSLLDELTNIATSDLRENKPYPNLNAITEEKVAYLQQQFDKCFSYWQELSTDTCTEKTIMMLCEQGSSICQRLESLVENDSDGTKGIAIAKDAKILLRKADQFKAKAKLELRTCPIDEQSPNVRLLANQVQSDTLLKGINENARYKIEIAKEILNDAWDRHEKAYQEMHKENERFLELIREMTTLDPQKIEFDVIKSRLAKGITELTRVREQWTYLVQFFEAMSNLIHCSLSTTLEGFATMSDKKRNLAAIRGIPVSNVFRDMLITQAVEADCIAFSVQTIAAAYVRVSEKHIITQISGLPKFIAVDHDDPDTSLTIHSLREELHSGTEKAQEEIQRLIADQRADFKSHIDTRQRRFRQEVESLLPNISEFKSQEIRETVSAGITKSVEELSKEVDDLV